MRFLIVLIVIMLTIYFFMEEPEPRPVEETFIGIHDQGSAQIAEMIPTA